MKTMSFVEMMRDPRALAMRAAELDVIACEYRAQAARSRRAAISAEVAGDVAAMEAWIARAEVSASDARAVEIQRDELIARFAPVVDLNDDCGVYA